MVKHPDRVHVDVFNVVPMSENNALDKAKSTSTVNCLNTPELGYGSEDHFAAMAAGALKEHTNSVVAADGRGEG